MPRKEKRKMKIIFQIVGTVVLLAVFVATGVAGLLIEAEALFR
jgi:hypothetical protein